MNVENHDESCVKCFEQLYLMIALTAKQWNYEYLVWGDLNECSYDIS